MKKGDIIYYSNPHPSHDWNNGLKVIVKKTRTMLHLCDLTELGFPDLENESVTTWKDNEFISKTPLTCKL